MPNYSGRCRNLTAEEKAAKDAAGIKPVIRLRVDEGEPIVVKDMVRGQVSFERDGIGDFVIVKSDGIPVYNFAVVVDDHLMGITHVLRGEEHLSNTPRQIAVYQALGWETPIFGHISLILGTDRTKMSKRHGSTSVVAYQKEGYLPEALVNFLALLGWAPEGEEEIFTIEDLVKAFSMDRVSKRPAVFDIEKLKWINGQYLRKLPIEELVKYVAPYLKDLGIEGERLGLVCMTFANHINTFNEIRNFLPLFMGEEAEPMTEEAKAVMAEATVAQVLKLFYAKMALADEVKPETVKTALKQIRKELGLGGAQVFMPVRIALTGNQHGPDIDKLAALMGREIMNIRLQKAAKALGFEL
jgi:nondiscriminating glutamyl-tRNA synthetase